MLNICGFRQTTLNVNTLGIQTMWITVDGICG
jgi:hypothetical protein